MCFMCYCDKLSFHVDLSKGCALNCIIECCGVFLDC